MTWCSAAVDGSLSIRDKKLGELTHKLFQSSTQDLGTQIKYHDRRTQWSVPRPRGPDHGQRAKPRSPVIRRVKRHVKRRSGIEEEKMYFKIPCCRWSDMKTHKGSGASSVWVSRNLRTRRGFQISASAWTIKVRTWISLIRYEKTYFQQV